MKTNFEKLLEKMNPNYSIDWINETEADFVSNNEKKHFKGKVEFNDNNSIIFKNIATNYSKPYLLNKIKLNGASLNLNLNYSGKVFNLYYSPQIGDSVLFNYDSPYFNGIKVGEKKQLKYDFSYCQLNNGPIMCGSIGKLKQNFIAVVTEIFSSTCVLGDIPSNYIKFKLLSIN